MSWHKTDVNGQIMWESCDGERVRDPSTINSLSNSPTYPTRPIYCSGVPLEFLVVIVVIAFILGIVIGSKFHNDIQKEQQVTQEHEEMVIDNELD